MRLMPWLRLREVGDMARESHTRGLWSPAFCLCPRPSAMSVNESRRSSAGEEAAAVDGEKSSIAGSHDGISWTAEEEARVVRKIDWHLLPGLTLLYLLSFLDRANSALGLECVADPAVGNAKLLGLLTEVGITDAADYNTSLALYFLRVTLLGPCC